MEYLQDIGRIFIEYGNVSCVYWTINNNFHIYQLVEGNIAV